MPHSGVVRESATTPLRVVFNASSKQSDGRSLNECLYAGPNLGELLFDFLLRFRSKSYAVTADISNAFHYVLLDPKNAKYANFLRPENSSNINTYKFKVTVFGVTSAPTSYSKSYITHL
ncbi:uncharacterized protein [Macrobrachium rosenbergii]|uniref:uncharacterized protein n=1 Tax=Macrobrachium rosenbergii TaxID=79674 RepID=UPI0034D4179F